MSEEMVFESIVPTEIPVTIGDKKYLLVEADEEATLRYEAARLKGATLKDGVITFGTEVSLAGPTLLSRCLYSMVKTPEGSYLRGSLIPLAEILSWYPRHSRPLIEKVKSISGLDKKEEEKVELGKK